MNLASSCAIVQNVEMSYHNDSASSLICFNASQAALCSPRQLCGGIKLITSPALRETRLALGTAVWLPSQYFRSSYRVLAR